MSARVGSVNAICDQITGRTNAGQERFNSRWGNDQAYWNDITNPIHLNTGYLKSIILELNKELQAAKAELVYEKKCREEQMDSVKYKTMQAQQAIINQKNEEKQYIRTLVEEQRNLKNQFFNSYRNEERLRINANKKIEELQRQLNSIKAKESAPQTSYTFQKSGGQVTQQQKSKIQDIISNACKESTTDNRCSSIYKNINKKLKGVWGVVTGLTFGRWSSNYQWEKWLIFSCNKQSIFVWKQKEKVIPSETSYQFSNSFGAVSQDQKKIALQAINKHISSNDSSSIKTNNIEKELITSLGGIWGVATSLENSWCIKAPAQKWLLFNSNLKAVFIWKNYQIQSQKKEIENNKQEEGKSLQSLVSLFTGLVMQQQKEQVKIEEQTDEANHNKSEQADTEFILVDSANSPGTESTYIKVLLTQLVLPSEDPFVRVEWVKQLMQKNEGGSWGTVLNVPLADWASKQDYSKWYIFQKNGTQVLIWSKLSTEPLIQVEEKQEQVQVLTENI